jgi:hypothetical protein
MLCWLVSWRWEQFRKRWRHFVSPLVVGFLRDRSMIYSLICFRVPAFLPWTVRRWSAAAAAVRRRSSSASTRLSGRLGAATSPSSSWPAIESPRLRYEPYSIIRRCRIRTGLASISASVGRNLNYWAAIESPRLR